MDALVTSTGRWLLAIGLAGWVLLGTVGDVIPTRDGVVPAADIQVAFRVYALVTGTGRWLRAVGLARPDGGHGASNRGDRKHHNQCPGPAGMLVKEFWESAGGGVHGDREEHRY